MMPHWASGIAERFYAGTPHGNTMMLLAEYALRSIMTYEQRGVVHMHHVLRYGTATVQKLADARVPQPTIGALVLLDRRQPNGCFSDHIAELETRACMPPAVRLLAVRAELHMLDAHRRIRSVGAPWVADRDFWHNNIGKYVDDWRRALRAAEARIKTRL